MANENLRAALQQAGLQADDLAQIVEVDVRTVRRWLSGRPPYPRQRGKVARALDTTEHDLWPEIAAAAPPRPPAAQPTDLLAGYPTVNDLAAPDWKALIRDVTDRIELLGDTLIPILGTPGVPELLAAKASHGCDVRILVAEPGRHIASLVDQAGIEIRVLEVPVHHTIHRFDEQLLLILHLPGRDAEQVPLLHLHRSAPGGLFDRFAEHYNDLWAQDSQPIKPDLDLVLDEDQDEGGEPGIRSTPPRRRTARSRPQRTLGATPTTLAPANHLRVGRTPLGDREAALIRACVRVPAGVRHRKSR